MLRTFAATLLAGLACATPAAAAGDTFSRVMGGNGGPIEAPRPALDISSGYPEGIAARPDGSVLVTDYLYDRVLLVKDGIASVAVTASRPTDVAVTPDGGYLVVESGAHRVTKVAANGTKTVVAGDGSAGTTGDGGAATSAGLYFPWSVAVMPDGGFVVSQPYAYRVRRVTADGKIRTILGDGKDHYPSDVPGTESGTNHPYGVAVMRDGSVLVAEHYGARVRRIDPAGFVRSFAGSGTELASGIEAGSQDGRDARTVGLGRLCDVLVAPDDSVFVTQSDCGPQPNERVYNRPYLLGRIGADGTYAKYAGTGAGAATPGVLAGKHRLDPGASLGRLRSLAMMPDGDLLFLENTNNVLWRVDSDITAPPVVVVDPPRDERPPVVAPRPIPAPSPAPAPAPVVTAPASVPTPPLVAPTASPARPLTARRGARVTLRAAGRRPVRVEIRRGGRRVLAFQRTPKGGRITITAPRTKGTYTVVAGSATYTLTVR